jgi:hypothetical protein
MVHHRFITWAATLLVAGLAGAAGAAEGTSARAPEKVVLELSGLT